jgi:hypothetical protein
MKECSTCRETKPVSEFYKNKARSDGLQHQCKICTNAVTNTYRKRRLKNDPEYRKRRNELQRLVHKKAYWEIKGGNVKVYTSQKERVCKIIKEHHDDMKDDPEHLTTEFLKSLLRVDCNGN